MRAVLAICGGVDYPDEMNIRVDVQLIRIVTAGRFREKPISQAAILLPPTTNLQLIEEIEDSFMIDESEIFQLYRGDKPSAWVILFTKATVRSLDLIAEYLNRHRSISRVFRFVHTKKSLKDDLGFDFPAPILIS